MPNKTKTAKGGKKIVKKESVPTLLECAEALGTIRRFYKHYSPNWEVEIGLSLLKAKKK